MDKQLKRRICGIKSQTEIAKELGTKPQAVSFWFNSQVPANRVISLCEVLDWGITPHEVRGDIYPNPTDGLPTNKQTLMGRGNAAV
ncbi:transcriptional regulator [Yersinia enterocolitica]|uniref:transcriptional regulator n=1 Tax=Yersinia enterocolitica TaxID=630 RepID=UPI000B631136|nr:YdaS family helix-turn-helix protein [Yersinia enterocolitica]OWF75997.1 Cro/Cl family transcriptional regulator [Yersinia kristensenii]MBW5836385.1 helix-turn-helix domain-containing protein [Yersinia enterocolitica]MBW5845549.1 helix-turn-helix domain-containing protein [Yersinia enterocolitica]MBW5863241.1 helix-turn-helix domain-containing protein [Yersinia enterocolitica]MBW5871089.1 helix-turn-helix domain-containing protein [Yersinia enterocolitica]